MDKKICTNGTIWSLSLSTKLWNVTIKIFVTLPLGCILLFLLMLLPIFSGSPWPIDILLTLTYLKRFFRRMIGNPPFESVDRWNISYFKIFSNISQSCTPHLLPFHKFFSNCIKIPFLLSTVCKSVGGKNSKFQAAKFVEVVLVIHACSMEVEKEVTTTTTVMTHCVACCCAVDPTTTTTSKYYNYYYYHTTVRWRRLMAKSVAWMLFI